MPQLDIHYILTRTEAICREVSAIEFRLSTAFQELAELRDQLRDAVDHRIPSMEHAA